MSQKLNNYVPTHDILVNRQNDLKNVDYPAAETHFKSEELSLIKLDDKNKKLSQAVDFEKLMHKKQDIIVELRQKENKSMEECIMIDKLNEDIK